MTVHLDDGTILARNAVLDPVPDFTLEKAIPLFGGERLESYQLPFSALDPKIIAMKYAELGRAVTGGVPVEVYIE